MSTRSRGWGNQWPRYAETKPIPVTDGISTSSKRGAMAESWWSQQFVEVLDRYGLGARMQRGRRYARSGQIVSFEVESGRLTALVQGSRSRPYEVTVDAAPATAAQWSEIDSALASRVRFAARLLAGDVPRELVEVFADAGVALLPTRWSDLTARCTCPDSANPCKHIAATLYVFADRLDDDPWLLLEWRGKSREQILEPLVSRRPAAETRPAADPAAVNAVAPWWPLDPGRIGRSAGMDEISTDSQLLEDVDPPDPPDLVLSRLDPLAVEIRNTPAVSLLSAAYEAVIPATERHSASAFLGLTVESQ